MFFFMTIIFKKRDKVYIDTHVRQNMITFNSKLKTENDEPNHILHFHTHFIPHCRNFTLSAAAFQLPAAHINNNNNPVRTEFSPFVCRVGVTSRCSSGVSTSPRSHVAVHGPLQRRISGVGVSIWWSRYFRFDSKGQIQLSCFQAQQPENSPATSCTVWEILQIIYVKITLRERTSLKNTCSNARLSFLYLHFHNTKLK